MREGHKWERTARNMMLITKIPVESVGDHADDLQIIVYLRIESTGEPLLDPSTGQNITAFRPVFRMFQLILDGIN